MIDVGKPSGTWRVDYFDDRFAKFASRLPEFERTVLVAAIENVLAVHGIGICASEWGKALGGGLYEFRIRRAPSRVGQVPLVANSAPKTGVLLRVFCTFHGDRVVLVFHGYDKRRDPSKRRQAREIRRARATLERWRRDDSAGRMMGYST